MYKSNEPGQLDRAGISYRLFDPLRRGIPGSFGILYTNGQFLDDHPTAAQDFVRASLKGMEDAIADPDAAVAASLEMIQAGGNKNFLSDEGESFRWQVEKDLVEQAKGDLPIGVIDPALLQAEVDAYTEAGVFDTAALDRGHLQGRPGRRGLRPRRQGDLPRRLTAICRDIACSLTANRARDGPHTSRTRRVCSMSCFSCATRASTPSNLRSLRRNSAKRTSARSP